MQKRLGNGIHGSGPAATRLVDPDVGNLIESDICKSSDPGPFFFIFSRESTNINPDQRFCIHSTLLPISFNGAIYVSAVFFI